jgi:hypothetical protein
MVAAVFWLVAYVIGPWWRLFFVMSGTVVPLALVGVFPTLPLLSVGLASIVRALSLVKNSPHCILPVSELGWYVEQVCSCPWSPPPKLMDERLICGAIGEGAHYVGVDSIGELVSLLRKLLDVVP